MRHAIPSEGLLESEITIIGGSPGKSELARNKIFSGPAGRILDRLLRNAGIPRSSCYITNVIPYYYKNTKELVDPKTGFESSEYKLCKAILLDQLQRVQSKVIVVLGDIALYALTGYSDILKYRGSILTVPEFKDKFIIPAIHPAKTLYWCDGEKGAGSSNYEYFIHFDLLKAKKVLLSDPSTLFVERDYLLEPKVAEILDYIDLCAKAPRVGFDIESKRTIRKGKFTDWEITCLSLSPNKHSSMCIPFMRSNGTDVFTPPSEIAIWKKLREFLQGPTEIIIQNAMYDAGFLLRKYGIHITNIHDTMVAQGILTPEFPKGLDFLTSLYTNEIYYKDDGKQYIKTGSADPAFWLYNAKDSIVLHEILDAQLQALSAQGNLYVYEQARKVLEPLLYMGYRGIAVNLNKKDIMGEALQREITRLEEEFKKLCKADINPRSPAQLKDYFYKTKRYAAIKKDGKVTTDEKALKKLAFKGSKEAEILLELRTKSKLKSTYMDMTLDDDGRMRTSFNAVGTTTGRLSSRQSSFGTGGNLQNLAKEYKLCLTPDPDNWFFEMDLSQAENRIVAYCAPEPKMIEAFETGQDVHSLTGALISGLSVEEVMEQHKAGIKCAIGGGKKTWRFWGKTSNHSLNYGLGARNFAARFEIPLADAEFIRQQYYNMYEGVSRYQAWIVDMLKTKNRTIVNPLGRSRIFLGRWEDPLFKEAYATFPQSTVADIINQRALNFIYYNQDVMAPVDLLTQVHDSVGFQINYKRHSIEEIAGILHSIKTSVEQPLTWRTQTFTIPIACQIGHNFAELTDIPLTDLDTTISALEKFKRS